VTVWPMTPWEQAVFHERMNAWFRVRDIEPPGTDEQARQAMCQVCNLVLVTGSDGEKHFWPGPGSPAWN
jgi:hypothetical protein